MIDLANDSALTGLQAASFSLNGTHSTDLITDKLLADIDAQPYNRPLFAYVAFNSVHMPLEVPTSVLQRYDGIIDDHDRKMLGAMVSHLDDAIGRVESALKRRRMWSNTLTVFTTGAPKLTDNVSKRG